MIAMGTETPYVSGFFVYDAYKMFCGVSEKDYEADEAAIATYNEQKGLEIYMNKIRDQECARQLDFINGESSTTTEVTNQVNTKIQGQILEDAFTFCMIDD